MRHIRVIQSFGEPRKTTNPYIVMLGQALDATPGLEFVRFSWRNALLADYDVFHFHWPETLLAGRAWHTTAGKHAAFCALLVRLALRRTPVVRTVHNLGFPPEATRLQRVLLGILERMTTLRILINPFTRLEPGQASVSIPHGHYRTWYAQFPRRSPVTGRFAFVGLIRPYKGVDDLIDAFRGTEPGGASLSLTITGKPTSREIEDDVNRRSAGDPRIHVTYGYVSEAGLVEAITDAQLVVLPYRNMHNSGSVLAALSLDRPVLVPRNEVTESLAAEVGPGWVHCYNGKLTAEDLRTALEALPAGEVRSQPDLSGREWPAAGTDHRQAYAEALELKASRTRKAGENQQVPSGSPEDGNVAPRFQPGPPARR